MGNPVRIAGHFGNAQLTAFDCARVIGIADERRDFASDNGFFVIDQAHRQDRGWRLCQGGNGELVRSQCSQADIGTGKAVDRRRHARRLGAGLHRQHRVGHRGKIDCAGVAYRRTDADCSDRRNTGNQAGATRKSCRGDCPMRFFGWFGHDSHSRPGMPKARVKLASMVGSAASQSLANRSLTKLLTAATRRSASCQSSPLRVT